MIIDNKLLCKIWKPIEENYKSSFIFACACECVCVLFCQH